MVFETNMLEYMLVGKCTERLRRERGEDGTVSELKKSPSVGDVFIERVTSVVQLDGKCCRSLRRLNKSNGETMIRQRQG
jgi:hypothetical protein